MENQTIGIKLADGSFYPILTEGQKASMVLELTTVRDDQQTIQLDLYRSSDATMDNADYVDTLLIENLLPRPREQPSISLKIDLDEDNTLSASIEDQESGESSSLTVSLLNLDAARLSSTPDFVLADENTKSFEFADPEDITDAVSINEEPSDTLTDQPFDEIDFSGDIPLDTLEDESPDIDSAGDELSDSMEEMLNEDLEKTADIGIDYHFSDVSVLEDVPRQNSSSSENLLSEEETGAEEDFAAESETSEESKDEGVVSEEEFPDFQDIPLSEPPVKDENSQEDDSSLFDFGEEFKDESFDDSIPAPSFSFSDLYEEEDMEKEERSSNKTLIPVIICIICAVISVAALALMLLFGPFSSKEGDVSSAQSNPPVYDNTGDDLQADVPVYLNSTVEDPVTEQKEIFADSTVTEPAKENEVVKIEAEVVVPEVPAVQKTEEKGVSYKIKWGDTLWDIADSYYKNPWLYPKIAKFNSIKNPDVIISGTWITIPPK